MLLMYHDDDCGELIDANGICPKHGFSVDMQSLGFKEVSEQEILRIWKPGRTFMGPQRKPFIPINLCNKRIED